MHVGRGWRSAGVLDMFYFFQECRGVVIPVLDVNKTRFLHFSCSWLLGGTPMVMGPLHEMSARRLAIMGGAHRLGYTVQRSVEASAVTVYVESRVIW